MPKFKMGKGANVITNEGGKSTKPKIKPIGGGKSISNAGAKTKPKRKIIGGGKKIGPAKPMPLPKVPSRVTIMPVKPRKGMGY